MNNITLLANTIKQAGVGAVNQGAPVTVMFGVVTNTSPLEVTVDQRFSLDEDFLIVPESLTEFKIGLEHTHSYPGGTTGPALTEELVIRRGLEAGDTVIMFRMQGGKQYLIFDRMAVSE
ncbi:DUF2577 domain-containing protein [Bacillus sp. 3255]|uniref:DUF2577 domain-containing protein n=1 Tax=Bacillus sp. 3255 TaxID=2817904 RepID=UPI0028660207|nr:DUF2577 domain-containing protein [Bacillus sp. 3255]MDR6883799.1 hypothetical protein [Bacillus sp. 3255]